MSRHIGFVMDPIESINIKKDSSFALMLEAQKRGWIIHIIEQKDLFLRDSKVWANAKIVTVKDESKGWFSVQKEMTLPLYELELVLMRKDPPFNMEYIVTTYLLELAEQQGTFVVNKPSALRDANEKLFTAWFPDCCPPTLVTRDSRLLKEFLDEHGEVIFKPLGGMGGVSIFLVRKDEPNFRVIVETITKNATQFMMAQKFIPEIKNGDKRVIVIDGEAFPYGLSRIPAEGDIRGNLAAGATAVGAELTERDKEICAKVGPVLKEKGILFAGLDIIGDYLTEINVTSPTCIREIDRAYNVNIAEKILNKIEEKL